MGESTRSERLLLEALRRQAASGEVILPSVRFTDPGGGDVEADIIVLIPDAGAAIIEIKGGSVSFEDGTWSLRHRRGARRIHPTRQARQARHALRRYLDRQPEWGHGLLRSAWLVAFPHTDVDGDMGPEARRDVIIDRSDLPHAMERIRAVLANPLDTDQLPSGDWCGDVVSLLLRAPYMPSGQPLGRPARGTRWALVATAVLGGVAVAGGALWWMLAAIGGPGRTGPVTPAILPPAASTCAPGYDPCLPIRPDLDCADVRQQVTVTGDDPYGLDRDRDGHGCTMYGPP